MAIELRPAVADDIETCARIIFDAFKGVADHHGFPPAFPSIDVARRVATLLIGLPAIHSLVAVRKEGPAGLLFLDEGDPIRGVSIVAVDPAAQRHGIGRALMQAALERARGARGIRLVQEAFNTGSMGLYASLGFAVKEPLVRLSGRLPGAPVEGVEIRPWTAADLEECERLCRRVHGITRTDDLRDALRLFVPFAAGHPGLGRGRNRGRHARAAARHRRGGPGASGVPSAEPAGHLAPLVPRPRPPHREAVDPDGPG
jgi:GNAT superfamily N-acetyltransferase